MIQGAETTLYATLSRELEDMNGQYLENSALKTPSAPARDVDGQEHLWEVTKGLIEPWLTSKDLSHLVKAS